MGRRKIEMKMVKDNNSRQVTFSKRRSGLFKKANELATLCGAEVAIVVFSPGGKPFSFGHPTVDSVAKRFLNEDRKGKGGRPDSDQKARIEKLSQHLNDLLKQLQAEKKRGEILEKKLRASGPEKYLMKPVEDLSKIELMEYKAALEDFREKLKGRVNEIEASSTLLLLSKDNASK